MDSEHNDRYREEDNQEDNQRDNQEIVDVNILTEAEKEEYFNKNEDYSDEAKFIRNNVEYYLRKFHLMRNSSSVFSWNWACFLLGFLWCMYRKLYLVGVVLLALAFIPGYLGLIVVVASWVVLGLLGNSLYMRHVEQKINEANALPGQLKENFLLRRGGTNLPLVIILVVLYIMLYTVTGII